MFEDLNSKGNVMISLTGVEELKGTAKLDTWMSWAT